MKAPRVSVLMCVFNGERFLREAVKSILEQTFTDFEFIICDDGSTDQTGSILDGFPDPRIVRLKNECNLGLTKSLNIGLESARGLYIARIDADDIAKPERLVRQVACLNANPQVIVLGSAYEVIDENGSLLQIHFPPTAPAIIAWRLCFGNPIAHSSVMFRRHVILRLHGYDETICTAQDYELWSRVNAAGFLISVLDTPLIQLRKHKSQITQSKQSNSRENALNTARNNIQRLLGQSIEAQVIVYLMLFGENKPEPCLLDIVYKTFELCLFRFAEQHTKELSERRQLLEASLLYLLPLARLSEAKRMRALMVALRFGAHYAPASMLKFKFLKFISRVIVPAKLRRYFRQPSSMQVQI